MKIEKACVPKRRALVCATLFSVIVCGVKPATAQEAHVQVAQAEVVQARGDGQKQKGQISGVGLYKVRQISHTERAEIEALEPPKKFAVVQATQIQGQSPSELLVSAHEKSLTAATVAELNEVIAILAKATEQEVSDEDFAYAQKLVSWTLNRRGEAFTDQAQEFFEAGQKENASRLESQAMADFNAALANDQTRWKARQNRGIAFALQGDFGKAVIDFSEVIEANPGYINAWFNRAEIYYEEQQFQKAVKDYSQVLTLRPGDQGALTGRGHAYFQQGHYEEAYADYNEVTQLSPNDAKSLTQRGDALCLLEKWEEAADDYRKAIESNHEFARAYLSASWLMSTCPLERYRDKELAVAVAQKAISLHSEDDYRYLDVLAAAHASAENYPVAVSTIEKAITIAPEREQKALQERLELYKVNKPYRQLPQK